MNNWRNRLLAVTAGAMSVTALYSCAVTGVGVVGYAGGYYEPYGYDYGGWGRGYYVAPGRGLDHRDDHRGGGRAPAYRPAPAGRSAPSLPHGSRGGRR
jgi:hypothetical protein